MTLLLIPALTALMFLALAAGVYYMRFRNPANARLQRLVQGGESATMSVSVAAAGGMEDDLVAAPLSPFVRLITGLGYLLPLQVDSEILKWELAQAGFRHQEARNIFAGARVLATVVCGLTALLTALTLHLAPHELLLVVGAGVGVGYVGPMVFVRSRQSKRQMEITLTLPDAIDLLVICVEAGQGLNAALMKVGKEIATGAGALSEDLMIVNNEMRAGVSRTQALRNLALRTGVDDVRSLVAVMIQSDRFGTSVAHALRIHASSLRTRRRQRAEETARKAPIKLLFPLVFCIFPELLVVILAPGMLQLFRALSQH